MIPKMIVVDPDMKNEDGTPKEGMDIYEDHLKVHPDFQEKHINQLRIITGFEFYIISVKEYKDGFTTKTN